MNGVPPAPGEVEAVVQRQLDAYNARDLEALLEVYAEDAEVFEHPSTLLAAGRAALRERFTARLREPNLHAYLSKRIVSGCFAIDHERVVRTFAEGPGELDLVMIYEVRDGKIRRAWNIVGAKTLDPAR